MKSVSSASFELRQETGGAATLVFDGCLNLESTAHCWRELQKKLGHRKLSSLDIDASRLKFEGSIGLALMKQLSTGEMTPGARVTLHGLDPDMQKLLDQFESSEVKPPKPETRLKLRVPLEAGQTARNVWRDLMEQITFVGAMISALGRAMTHRQGIRWSEVIRTIEKAGANALLVVALFSWLVGMVMALEAARPLQKMGAEFYVADMIGFASIRDIGPMVAAIMLAGRSGSAFAAELGTMKVSQELDALTVMGLDPIRFLVLPRVLGTVLLMPLLTLYSILASIIGGMMVMRFLGYSPLLVFQEILVRVELNDWAVGLEKSVIFGLVVGCIGCLRGLQTGAGPRAVGASTTSAVVAAILLVILADTAFSMAQFAMKS